VFTACVPVVSTPADLFKHADVNAITNLITKMAIDKIQSTKISDAREAIVNKCVDILTFYRETFCTANSPLQIPDSLRSFPLLVLAVAKNILFRPGDVRPDERAFHMYRFKTLSVDASLDWIYPKLYNLAAMTSSAIDQDGQINLPPALNLSSEKMDRKSPFLLDNGYVLSLYVPKTIPLELLQPLFGVTRVDQVEILPVLENEVNMRARSLVEALRRIHHQFLRVEIIREGDRNEANFLLYLIEDRSRNITSYAEFMVQLQRSVTSKSSVK